MEDLKIQNGEVAKRDEVESLKSLFAIIVKTPCISKDDECRYVEYVGTHDQCREKMCVIAETFGFWFDDEIIETRQEDGWTASWYKGQGVYNKDSILIYDPDTEIFSHDERVYGIVNAKDEYDLMLARGWRESAEQLLDIVKWES